MTIEGRQPRLLCGARRVTRRLALRRRLRASLPVSAALLLGSLLVWDTSSATFTATTDNGKNAWEAGTVKIGLDDGSGSGTPTAMLKVSAAQPGQRVRRCIKATYSGNVAASVRIYLSGGTGNTSLDPYLDLTVEEGSGASFSTCAGFSGTAVYTGTLGDFRANKTAFSTGVGTWTPTSAGSERVYRFTVTVNKDAPSTAADKTATAAFTWEARTT